VEYVSNQDWSEKEETYQGNKAVRMERMLAREDVELPGQEGVCALGAPLAGVDANYTPRQGVNVLLDGVRASCRIIHHPAEAIDVLCVSLERMADLILEVVNDNEIGEKR